ncbi:MAG TPA: glycosyltransferase family 1 protein [Gemmatimonadaceae bacterium]|nr:glycosyltransferase family 1 protein [Gemmatimonadaceae bacterium]
MTHAPSASAEGMRLAIFTDTYPPHMNGVAAALGRLASAVRDRGGEVRVVTTSDPRAPAGESEVRRWPSIPFWAYPQLRVSAPPPGRIARELAAWRPTLVHIATPFGVGLAARRAAIALGAPMVTSYHTSFSQYAAFYKLGKLSEPGWSFLRWFHNSGQRTYCPSNAIRDELAAHGFRNARIWGRGVDISRFNPGRRTAEMRERFGARPDQVVVAYIGRIAAEKCLAVAAAAMRRLEADEKIRFVIVGEGPYESKLRALSPASTVFTGRLSGDTLSEAYASADLFMFPSNTDTFGQVLLEAMASGLPVVAADAGPTREVVGAEAGSIFPAGDDAQLAAQLQRLARDPSVRASMSAAALRAAAGRSWNSVFDDLVRDYNTVSPAPG